MAVTVRDFITECELYPYSRENFELMKECSELKLTEQFICNQLYMQESLSKIVDNNITLENNYLMESIESMDLDIMMEQYEKKSSSIIVRIYNSIMKLVGKFAAIFRKIGNKFDSTTVAGQHVKKKLEGITLSDEAIESLESIIDTAKNNPTTAFPIRKVQPYAKKISLKHSGNKDIYDLKDALAVALSDETVIASALPINSDSDTFDPSRIGIMDPDEIYNAIVTLMLGKEREVANVMSNLLKSWSHIKANGLEIDVNTNSINKTIDNLNKLSDEIREKVGKVLDQVGSGYSTVKQGVTFAKNLTSKEAEDGNTEIKPSTKSTKAEGYILKLLDGVDSNLPGVADVNEKLNKILSIITGAVGQTTKVYVSLNAYRVYVIKQLDGWLKSVNS